LFDECEEPSPSGDILDDDDGYEQFYNFFDDALVKIKERAEQII
jgi:hypothetical protein